MPVTESVNIIVTGGRAYLPAQARTSFALIDSEPVFQSEVAVPALVQAGARMRLRALPLLSDNEVAAIGRRNQPQPLLKAIKTSSEKRLNSAGAWYNIAWTDDHIGVTMSTPNERGRWISDREKYRRLPLDTELTEIIGLIEQDARSRPENW